MRRNERKKAQAIQMKTNRRNIFFILQTLLEQQSSHMNKRNKNRTHNINKQNKRQHTRKKNILCINGKKRF